MTREKVTPEMLLIDDGLRKFPDEVFEEYCDYIRTANAMGETKIMMFFALTECNYDIDKANELLKSITSTGKLAYYLYNLPEDKFEAIAMTVSSIVE